MLQPYPASASLMMCAGSASKTCTDMACMPVILNFALVLTFQKVFQLSSDEKCFVLWHLATRSCWFYSLLGLLFWLRSLLVSTDGWFPEKQPLVTPEMKEIHEDGLRDSGVEMARWGEKCRKMNVSHRVSDGGEFLVWACSHSFSMNFFLNKKKKFGELGCDAMNAAHAVKMGANFSAREGRVWNHNFEICVRGRLLQPALARNGHCPLAEFKLVFCRLSCWMLCLELKRNTSFYLL